MAIPNQNGFQWNWGGTPADAGTAPSGVKWDDTPSSGSASNAIRWDDNPAGTSAPPDGVQWDDAAKSEAGVLASVMNGVGAVGRGVKSGVYSAAAGMNLLAGMPIAAGIDKLRGDHAATDWWAGTMVEPAYAVNEREAPRQGAGVAEKGLFTVGRLVPDMAMMFATRGASAEANALGRVAETAPQLATRVAGDALMSSAKTSALPATLYGAQTARDVVQIGGSSDQALTAGLTEGLMTIPANALPLGATGSWMSRAGQGAASNVVADMTQNAVVNQTLPDELQRPLTDPTQMGLSALIGAPMGVAFGERPAATRPAPSVLNDVLERGAPSNAGASALSTTEVIERAGARLAELSGKRKLSKFETEERDLLRQAGRDPAALAEALGVEISEPQYGLRPVLALPPPTRAPIQVDRAGVAATPEQLAAQRQRNIDLGLTPDILRTQAIRWDDQAQQSAAAVADLSAIPDDPTSHVTPMPRGARNVEQMLSGVALDARDAVEQRQKERQLDELARESRLPAELFDAEQDARLREASGESEVASAPTAMQLAMQQARQKQSAQPVPAEAVTVPATKTTPAQPESAGNPDVDMDAPNFGMPEPSRTLADDDPLLQSKHEDQSPERQAMRADLVAERFAGKQPVADDVRPIALVMGGGGASGKGTILKLLRQDGEIPEGAVELDPDNFKTGDAKRGLSGLPEYHQIVAAGDSRAAGVTHEESSALYKQALSQAVSGRYNVVLDRTMSDAAKGVKDLQALKDAGYEIRFVGASVDTGDAVARAVKRAQGPEKRYVPVKELVKAHKGFSNAFEQYVPFADRVRLYDNNVPKDTQPALMARGEGGRFEVTDAERYNRFRLKGDIDESANTHRGLAGTSTKAGVEGASPVRLLGEGGRGVQARIAGESDRGTRERPAVAEPLAPEAQSGLTPAPSAARASISSPLSGAKRLADGILVPGEPGAIRSALRDAGIKGAFAKRGDGIILQGKPQRDFERWQSAQREAQPAFPAEAAAPAGKPDAPTPNAKAGNVADQEQGAPVGDAERLEASEALLSRSSVIEGAAEAKGVSVEEARSVADAFVASYNGHIPLTVRVGKSLDELYGPNAAELGNAKGAYHAKSRILTLAADRLSSRADAETTLRHEVLGHYGLNTLDPADKRAVLENVLSHRTKATSFALRGLWKSVDARYADKSDLIRAEEVFALAAERDPGTLGKAWDDIVSAVIRGLRKIGVVKGPTSLAEIRQMIRRIGDGIREGSATQKTKPESDDAQFRAATAPPLTPTQVAAMQKIGAMRPAESFKAAVARITDRAKLKIAQGLVDQFAPLRNLDMTAYMQARLSKGTDGALEAMFLHGKPKLVDGALKVEKDGTEGLRGILSDLNGEHEQFLAWIAGNRAEALSKEWTVDHGAGNVERYKNEADARAAAKQWPLAKVAPASRERLFTPAEVVALKALNQGTMANGRKRSVAFAKAHAEFRAYQKSVLDIAEEAGLIDGDSRATWESDFYVPFYRVLEDEKAGTFKPAGGASLVRQEAFRELRGGKGELQDLLNNVLQNWSHLLAGSMRNMAGVRALAAAEKAGLATRIKSAEKDSVWVQEKGQQAHYRVDDDLVLDALAALDYSGIKGVAMDVMRKFKHALTIGVTISPTFRIRNLMRDTISALGTADDAGKNPLRNLVDGWKGTKHGSDTDVALLSGGGKVRFGTMLDGEAKTAKRLINMGVKDADIFDTPEKVKNGLRAAWDWWDRVGDRSETVNRAAIYKNAIKAGKSHLEASYEARDLMDFTMSGKWAAVRFLTGVVPFLNARAQGLYKLGRAAKGNPTRFAAVTGAVAMASALTYLLQKDDEDYKALPDWARDTYWCVKLGDKMIYIPKPFEIGALGTVVERGTEMMLGGDDYRAGDFASSIAGLLMNTLSMNPMPQAMKPLVEAIYNTDSFRDQSIDSMGDENLPARDRYDASTSAGAIAAGRVADAVVGSHDLGSPKRIEHMVRGYFGWLGTQALNVSDLLLRDAMDLPANPKRDLTKTDNVMVLGDLVKDAEGGSSKYIERFYDVQRDIEQTYRAMRNARATGDDARADELASDPQLESRPDYKRANRRMQRINDQIKRLRNDRELSAREKRLELDALYSERNALAKETDESGRAAE